MLTDDAVLARPDFRLRAHALLEAGGPEMALHLRGPETDGRTLFEHARALVGTAREAGGSLVVNDRVDVALTVGAPGVHLARRSLPVEAARRVLGPEAGVGVSVHADDEAARAAEDGADWIFVGTIYRSTTHPGREGRGVDAVASAVHAVAGATRPGRAVPLFAIGGVTPARVPAVRAAGARGAAVLGGVWADADPLDALRRYLQALEVDG